MDNAHIDPRPNTPVPKLPYRKVTRLRGFDYRSPGPYAITICTHHRRWRFGSVSPEGELRLNAVGRMITAVWQEVPYKFPGTELDAFVVMPNHLHAILTLCDTDVEANPDLADIIGWFKGTTTHRYIRGVHEGQWLPFEEKLWQPKFYEYIVRNDLDMNRFRAYIEANPAEWADDRYRDPE